MQVFVRRLFRFSKVVAALTLAGVALVSIESTLASRPLFAFWGFVGLFEAFGLFGSSTRAFKVAWKKPPVVFAIWTAAMAQIALAILNVDTIILHRAPYGMFGGYFIGETPLERPDVWSGERRDITLILLSFMALICVLAVAQVLPKKRAQPPHSGSSFTVR